MCDAKFAKMSDHFRVSFPFLNCCLSRTLKPVPASRILLDRRLRTRHHHRDLEPFVEYFRDRKRVVVKHRAQYLHICTG